LCPKTQDMKHALIGFLVSSLGIAVWSLLLFLLPAVWAILAMVPVLFFYWRYFTGRYIPGPWGGGQPRNWGRLREGAAGEGKGVVSGPQVIAALLFVLIVQASFVVTFCLFPFPAERFTADYKQLGTMPAGTAWALIVMSSIVAGICEETGFRGYMQVPLQKRYGPTTAIIGTSLLFTLIHLSHRWAAPILPQIFFASVLLGLLAYRSGSLVPGIIGHAILDIFDYSFWWTTITGKIDRQTIFATGIDTHFAGWVLLLAGACLAFFRVINTPTFAKH
jgi:membrane protease YdiL (CAAX protease family)